MLFKSPAKINLALDILKKDPSGFHLIQTIFQEVSDLFDELEVKHNFSGISIKCDNPAVPLDETNTVFKTIKFIQKKFRIKSGISIYIKKNIPLQSGLGGGSSDGATALKALNKILRLNISEEEMERLSAEIGMDIPFFIKGGTALGTHFGEKITALPALNNLKIKIINTKIPVDTCWAYAHLNLSKCGKNIQKTEKMIAGLKENNSEKIIENIHNDFEPLIFGKYPALLNGKAHLTGTGGTLFKISKG